VDGVLLSADGAALILYPAGKTTGDYVLPESVTTIQNGAMAASRIQNLTLNESLVSIQNGALASSISLESITFAENGCLEEIHSDAFSGCTALRALAFPDSLLYIGSGAFALCRLTDVILGENTMLGSKAIPAWNGLTIYGTSGSEAEAYADEWKIRFIKETDVPVTAVSLEMETLTLTPGERMQLTAVLSPADTTETRLIWTSSDHTVAAVDESGCITARSTGEAIITAQAANGSIAQCTVSVKKTEAVAESITLNAASIALTPGNTMQLLAIVAPAEAARTTQLSWQSSDEKVARYVNGRVVAIAEGEATIACTTANGLIATCRITVGDVLPPEVIEPDLIEPDLLLPAALKMIAEEAFAGGAFAAVQIPEGANEIGKRAFADCKGLVQISIPDSVTTIADDAFEGCSTVLFICSEGSAAQLYADAKGFAWVDN